MVFNNGNVKPKPAKPTRIKYMAKRRKPTFLFTLIPILLVKDEFNHLKSAK
jgi:hypothetical protein